MEESITPGQNDLPPRKAINGEYTPDEKAIIVARAAKLGTHVVVDAYGMDWHHIASWKRFYGTESEFNTMSKKKNNKTADAVKSKSTAKLNVADNAAMSVAPVLIIQSPSGQEITPEDVRAKISTAVGTVDKVYIRADEGKAYWVRGEGDKDEHGAVELW